MSIEFLVQQLINALSLGSMYALFALGLAMVFSILGLLNFAFGEIVTITGYVIFMQVSLGVSFPLAAIGGIVSAVLVSMLIEQVAFRPLRRASFATVLFSSFAVGVIIQNLIRQFVSPRPKGVPVPDWLTNVLIVGPFRVGVLPLLTFAVGFTSLLLLVTFMQKTSWGLAMRAAAQDFEIARLMGIRANRIIALSFAISGLLAGIGGWLWLAHRGTVNPQAGFVPILNAFVAIVIGGLGNLRAAVVGGFVLAFIQVALEVLLPGTARPFIDAFSLLLVVVILYFKPQGLVSKASEVKVS
jgi:branched-chain amino acid transport system permease protein